MVSITGVASDESLENSNDIQFLEEKASSYKRSASTRNRFSNGMGTLCKHNTPQAYQRETLCGVL
ncbi:MAG TPA: hypothetical protein VHV83_11515, partial [Armatimonadota bacterium]|nr:hypothetical protein [Armatimonadota bacterium]